MTSALFRLNAIQNELRDVLSLSRDNYKLEVIGNEIGASFIGLGLHSVFQPIIDLRTKSKLGQEALLRPFDERAGAIAPLAAFKRAEALGQLVKLDRLARTLHTLNHLNAGNDGSLLFLNVHAELLVAVQGHGKVFERILHQQEVATGQVVIEISESAVSDSGRLQEAIASYRERGYSIALDDFGRRHLDLQRIWRLRPDYVKLDGTLFALAIRDDRLRGLLAGLTTVLHDLGSRVVASGIETPGQLDLVLASGIHLAQGFLFARPSSLSEHTTLRPTA